MFAPRPIRTQGDRLLEMPRGLLEEVNAEEPDAELVVRLGAGRVEGDRLLEHGSRFPVEPPMSQNLSPDDEGFYAVGVDGEGLSDKVCGLRPQPACQLEASEDGGGDGVVRGVVRPAWFMNNRCVSLTRRCC